jgi:succinate dehydrogenase / fumarate reductase cytochrome b subunit
MTPSNRPLSPHLQVYRLPLVSLMSITHRISGVALSAGTILLVIWLGSAAYGPETYDNVSALMGSPLGLLVLFGFTAAFYYHLSNGVRHMLWDIGQGFELPQVARSNKIVIAAAFFLTLLTWYFGLTAHAGILAS